eukprot:m.258921 g.258921  ORF g.258921 m.258921 type:complete len:54 (-) comp15549_c0_seq1:553-714(-)
MKCICLFVAGLLWIVFVSCFVDDHNAPVKHNKVVCCVETGRGRSKKSNENPTS